MSLAHSCDGLAFQEPDSSCVQQDDKAKSSEVVALKIMEKRDSELWYPVSGWQMCIPKLNLKQNHKPMNMPISRSSLA